LVAVLALIAGTGVASSAAFGQGASKDQDALGGPKVVDHSIPGQTRQFAGGAREKGAPRPLPPMAMMRAISSLEQPDAPEGLALTEDQKTQLKSIREEQQTLMRVYVEQHKDEILGLRERLPERERRRVDGFLNGPAGGPAGGPDGARGERGRKRGPGSGPEGKPDAGPMDAMPEGERGARKDRGAAPQDEPSPEALAARQRLREIMEGAPKPEDAQVKAMAVLTPAQQEHVKAKLEEARARIQEGGKDEMRGEGGPRERMLEKLSPEDREKLKGLSPEERRAFLREKLGDQVPARKGGK
jgi:Spy/CpxP family protein refolding chaperone